MLHRNIVMVENDVIHGKGLVATGLIRKGEVVSKLDPAGRPMYAIRDVMNWSQEEQDRLLIYGYQCSDDTIVMEREPDRYMNHSCDPNTWWINDDTNTMIARRDIQPGEEITYDYATTEIAIPFEMECRCGASGCRGKVTNLDHLDPAWQAIFGTHLPGHTLRAIEAAKIKENR